MNSGSCILLVLRGAKKSRSDVKAVVMYMIQFIYVFYNDTIMYNQRHSRGEKLQCLLLRSFLSESVDTAVSYIPQSGP
jgi:hypothetical protein